MSDGAPTRRAVSGGVVGEDPVEEAVRLARRLGQRLGGDERADGRAAEAAGDPGRAGTRYAALLPAEGRRDLGAFYTPPWLARRLVRTALAGRHGPRVVDPACGGGAFLLEAARALAARLGDRRAAAARIFGIDRDPGAVAVCRAVLEAAGFEIPEGHLVCADALAGPWPGAPFDAVVGNPPYRNVVRLPEAERRALKARFSTFRNKCDLYGLFVEAAADHLAPGGRLALLVSDSFLGTSSFAPLRRRLFASADLSVRSLDRVPSAAFPGAAVHVLALVSEARPRASGDRVRFGHVRRAAPAVHVSCARLAARCGTSAAVPADPAVIAILDRMATGGVPLGALAEVHLGVKTGDDGRFFVPGQARPDGAAWVPCVRGRDVSPFSVRTGGFLDYRPEVLRTVHGARPRARERFDRPGKILLRETSGRRLVAAWDAHRRFPLDTVHVVLPRPGASAHYLLAVLGAAPTSAYYGQLHPGPHVKVAEVRALPIPPPPAPSAAAIAEAIPEAARYVAAGDPDAPLPGACRAPGARTRLLDVLARLLSGPVSDPWRETAKALLDGVVADAYGLGPEDAVEMGAGRTWFEDPVAHRTGEGP